MAERRKVPYSNTDIFTQLCEDNVYYVDKSDFITHLIRRASRIELHTRPRRFGKSLMLTLCKTFFEYRLQSDGTPVDNRHWLEGLKVMSAGDDVTRHIGQYPTIFMTLKAIAADTFDGCFRMLSRIFRAAALDVRDQIQFGQKTTNKMAELDAFIENPTLDRCENSLRTMTEALYEAFGRKVVVLIDEYDVPLQEAGLRGFYDPMVDFIKNFFSRALKANNTIERCVITGCMNISRESIFSDLNQLTCYSVLSPIEEEFYGLTRDEVEEMLRYYGLESHAEDIKKWYDGYNFYDREVYNPFSVLQSVKAFDSKLDRGALVPFWVNSGGTRLLFHLMSNTPKMREEIEMLMQGKKIEKIIDENLTYRELIGHGNGGNYEIASWSLMLFSGYVKAVKRKPEDGRYRCRLAVPNYEIKLCLRRLLDQWWSESCIGQYPSDPLVQAMLRGDTAAIQSQFQNLLAQGMSSFDYNEAFYHGMAYDLLCHSSLTVLSNSATGVGRADILVAGERDAVVIELKCVTQSAVKRAKAERDIAKIEELMEKKLDEGERQLRKCRYDKDLRFDHPNVTTVKSYAICFCRKFCRARLVVL